MSKITKTEWDIYGLNKLKGYRIIVVQQGRNQHSKFTVEAWAEDSEEWDGIPPAEHKLLHIRGEGEEAKELAMRTAKEIAASSILYSDDVDEKLEEMRKRGLLDLNSIKGKRQIMATRFHVKDIKKCHWTYKGREVRW